MTSNNQGTGPGPEEDSKTDQCDKQGDERRAGQNKHQPLGTVQANMTNILRLQIHKSEDFHIILN